MFVADTKTTLRFILDQVREHVDRYHSVTHAHLQATILANAGREVTTENIGKSGRDAPYSAPTMWR